MRNAQKGDTWSQKLQQSIFHKQAAGSKRGNTNPNKVSEFKRARCKYIEYVELNHEEEIPHRIFTLSI